MAFNTPRMPSGRRYHRVTVRNPQGEPVADGDGGSTQEYDDAESPWHVAIEPATVRTLERVAVGTVSAQASHVVTGPYRSDVTTESRLAFGARTLYVVGVINVDERNIETIALCSELVT